VLYPTHTQACLADSCPPVSGVSDTSRRLMDVVHRFNQHVGRTACCYTFEAGPDPVLLFLERDAAELFSRLLYHFPPAKEAMEAFAVDDYFYGSVRRP
jgi:diphosphomevalonate decarboxylase